MPCDSDCLSLQAVSVNAYVAYVLFLIGESFVSGAKRVDMAEFSSGRSHCSTRASRERR